MIKLLKLKTDKDKAILGIFICLIFLLVGYVLLNFVSKLEKPPLGQTVYIVFGIVFMAIACVGIFVIIRHLYSTNKNNKRKELRRKKHKLFYLKKELENEKFKKNS